MRLLLSLLCDILQSSITIQFKMMCTHELACGTSNGASDTNDIYTHNIVIIIIIIYCVRAKEGEIEPERQQKVEMEKLF